MHAQHRTRHQSGFTLIEVMVVVVILGILVAFAVPNIMDNPEKARLTKAKHDLRTIENALEMYKLDNFRYPTSAQGLEALVERPDTPPVPENWQSGGYLRELPRDPWGNSYEYLGPEDGDGGIEVLTLGADDRPGGDGPDRDISSRNLESG
ncbi:MAG: type II secretion system major pseudopilin GspG [Arhodomonas sp.]|nr:type II secretion system major pseudopilin GspG [Arhodomonas sp.]